MDVENIKQKKEQEQQQEEIVINTLGKEQGIGQQKQGKGVKGIDFEKIGNIYQTITNRWENNKRKLKEAKAEAERLANGQDIRGMDFFMLLLTMGVMNGVQSVSNTLKELKAEVVYNYYQIQGMKENIAKLLIKNPNDIKYAYLNDDFKARFIRGFIENTPELKHFVNNNPAIKEPKPLNNNIAKEITPTQKSEDEDVQNILKASSDYANNMLKHIRGYIEKGEKLPEKIVLQDGKVIEIPKELRETVNVIDELEQKIKEGMPNFADKLATDKNVTKSFIEIGKSMANADNLYDAIAKTTEKGYNFVLSPSSVLSSSPAPERMLAPERVLKGDSFKENTKEVVSETLGLDDFTSVVTDKARQMNGDTVKAFEYFKFKPKTQDGKGMFSSVLDEELKEKIEFTINDVKQKLGLDDGNRLGLEVPNIPKMR